MIKKSISTSPRSYLREKLQVQREGSEIYLKGDVNGETFRLVLATIHSAEQAGYDEIKIDFSKCTKAYPAGMLPLCAYAISRREVHGNVEIALPEDMKMSRLFRNTNWAHFLDPRDFDPSESRKVQTQLPATRFHNSDEQSSLVSHFVETLLGVVEGVPRENFSAVEWALNEITDNVLNHSQSKFGGLVQLSVLQQAGRLVEFCVCDAGVGIPNSLRTSGAFPKDEDALEQAIREGVTRDPAVGQGNGLYGTVQICNVSKGRLRIDSGYASLIYDVGQMHLRPEGIPLAGTLVDAVIRLDREKLLGEALKFKGVRHTPIDFVEHRYEAGMHKVLEIDISKESASFGSRQAAKPVRIRIKNLLDMNPDHKFRLDFSGVPIISSSYADEVFGRLFVEIGPLAFVRQFEMIGMNDTVRNLIDRAMRQRSATDFKISAAD